MRNNFMEQPSRPVEQKTEKRLNEKIKELLFKHNPFKSRFSKKKKENQRFKMTETFMNLDETDAVLEKGHSAEPLQFEKTTKLNANVFWEKHRDRFLDVLCITGCIYFCFLTFGVWVTDYQYNDNGKIAAQQMSYDDIVKKKSFEVLLEHYLTCRDLYEKALEIDKKLAMKESEPFTLAPEYEALVKETESLYTKTEALNIDAQYEQIRSMILVWLKDDYATYCKNMSAAISQNNESTAQAALVNREATYTDFSLITQNIVAMGDTITGADLVNVKEWDVTDIYK